MESLGTTEQEEDWQEAMEDDQDDTELFVDAIDHQDHGQYELHKAVWEGNLQKVKELIAKPGAVQAAASSLDLHGNTVTHLAGLRGNVQVLGALLDAGLPAAPRTPTRWLPRHTALQAGHKQAVARLDTAQMEQLKLKMKQHRATLMTRLSGLPDFTMQLKWELVSSVPGVSMLLRRVAPHDTYTLYKQGAKLRVDGTLMGASEGDGDGLDAGSTSGLLPQWERGHFSLVYDGSVPTSPRVLFINHTEKTWIDLKALHKALKPEEQESLNQQLETSLMATAAAHGMLEDTVVKSRDFRFEPVHGWIHKAVVEEVDGWHAKVYEASFALVKLKRFRLPCPLGASATWEQYLATDMPQDMVLEVPMHPLSSMMGSKQDVEAKETAHAMRHAAIREARRLTSHLHPAPPPARHLVSSTTSTDISSVWHPSIHGIPSTTSTVHQSSMKRQGSLGRQASIGRQGSLSHPASITRQGSVGHQPGTGRQGSMGRQGSGGLWVQTSRNGREGTGAGLGTTDTIGSSLPAGSVTPSCQTPRAPAGVGPQSNQSTEAQSGSPSAAVLEQTPSVHAWLDLKEGGGPAVQTILAPVQTEPQPLHSFAGAQSVPLFSEQAGQREPQIHSSASNIVRTAQIASAAGSTRPATAASGGNGHSFKPARRVTGRCWMAEGFPLSLHDLIPLLHAISTTNKYMAKVAQFMSKYGDRKEFPVKVQVPLMFTLSFIVTCKKFKLLPTQSSSTGTSHSTSSSASGVAPKKKSFWHSIVSDSTASSSRKTAQADALPVGFFEVPAGYTRIEEDQAKKRSANGGLF